MTKLDYECMLRISYNGFSFYVIGERGQIAVIGSYNDCREYIKQEVAKWLF